MGLRHHNRQYQTFRRVPVSAFGIDLMVENSSGVGVRAWCAALLCFFAVTAAGSSSHRSHTLRVFVMGLQPFRSGSRSNSKTQHYRNTSSHLLPYTSLTTTASRCRCPDCTAQCCLLHDTSMIFLGYTFEILVSAALLVLRIPHSTPLFIVRLPTTRHLKATTGGRTWSCT